METNRDFICIQAWIVICQMVAVVLFLICIFMSCMCFICMEQDAQQELRELRRTQTAAVSPPPRPSILLPPAKRLPW